jgi:RimJ/RimL family protein N-acetyltransferase
MPQTGDFASYYQIYADPQTNLFNPAGPMRFEKAGSTFAAMRNHWSEHHFGNWVIRDRATDAILGFGGLSYSMYGIDVKLNLGYRFDKKAWGKGYATELAIWSIRYGFDELGFDTIYALVRPNHHASIHVLEKCQMQICGALDDVPGQESSLVYAISK